MCPCPSTAWSHPHPSFHYHLGPSMLYLLADSVFCSSLYMSVSLLYSLHPRMELGNPAHGAWPFSLQIFSARGRGHLSPSPCHQESSEHFHSCASGKSTSSQSEINHPPSWGLAKQFLSLGGNHRPQPPSSLPPVRPFFLPTVIPLDEPSFLLPVYQKPRQLSAAH